jgi:hypothetical protein
MKHENPHPPLIHRLRCFARAPPHPLARSHARTQAFLVKKDEKRPVPGEIVDLTSPKRSKTV